MRHFAQLVVIHCVNDDRLGERAVAAYAVAHRVVGNVAAALDNVANHHVAKLEFAKLNTARRICRTRGEHLPFAIKVVINKRAGGAEINHFRPCFGAPIARGSSLHWLKSPDLHTQPAQQRAVLWLLTFSCKTPCKETGRFGLHATGGQTLLIKRSESAYIITTGNAVTSEAAIIRPQM